MVEYTDWKKSMPEAVELAYSEFQSLGEEMREMFDDLSEKSQEGERGQMLEAAADEMEGLDEPTVPKLLEEIEVTWKERQIKRPSKSDRRDAAITILEGVIDALDKKLQEIEALDDSVDGKLEQSSEGEAFREDINNLIDAAAGVDFPGSGK